MLKVKRAELVWSLENEGQPVVEDFIPEEDSEELFHELILYM